MAVKSSPETIREMKSQISKTINDIQLISSAINQALASSSNWDDAQSAQYNDLMQRTAKLTEGPVDTLEAALPQLEKLAQALDDYNKVRF